MVVTHSSMKKRKRPPVFVKPDNPARKNMSYKDALADNERIRQKRLKVEAYAKSLDDEPVKAQSDLPEVPQEPVVDNTQKIKDLQAKLETIKGPGSRAKKDKIRAEIEKLEGDD